MRKIELEMNRAILNNENWQKDNTAVTYDPETNNSKVFLHGNLIAVVGDDHVEILDGGYQSKTTKSRLNAICSEHCITGEGVFQKNYQWFVRRFVGMINGQNVFKTEEFDGSYLFA